MKKYCIINGKKYYISSVLFNWVCDKKMEVNFVGGGWAVINYSEIIVEK